MLDDATRSGAPESPASGAAGSACLLRAAIAALGSDVLVVDRHAEIVAMSDAWLDSIRPVDHAAAAPTTNLFEAVARLGDVEHPSLPTFVEVVADVLAGDRPTYEGVLHAPATSPPGWARIRVTPLHDGVGVAGAVIERIARPTSAIANLVLKEILGIADTWAGGGLLLDESQHVLQCSSKFANLVGYSADELVGSVPPHPFAPSAPVAAATGATGTTEQIWELTHRRGRPIEVTATAHALGLPSEPLNWTLVIIGRAGETTAGTSSARERQYERVLQRIAVELDSLGSPISTGLANDAIRVASEGLSNRQRDVLRSVLDGQSVADIAETLHLSPHTVRSHLKALYRRFGVHNRAELLLALRSPGPSQGG